MHMRISCLLGLAAILTCGCSVGAKQRLISTALSSDSARPEYLEATLRVMDQHPGYVDELFQVARKHPRTMDRFLANAAADLDDPTLARQTAAHLARHPEAITEVFTRTLDEARDKTEVRDAIGAAIDARRDVAVQMITDDADRAEKLLDATVDRLPDSEAARQAFLQVMQTRAPELLALIADDPATLRAMLLAALPAGLAGSLEVVELPGEASGGRPGAAPRSAPAR